MNEKGIYELFRFSIWLKALQAGLEIAGGIAFIFFTPNFILSLVNVLTAGELSEDPRDIIAGYVIRTAQSYSESAQLFLVLYLISHGIVKLFLAGALLKNKIWAYPLSIVVFGLFIAYQLYQYTFSHSVALIALTIIDIIIIWLIWHEYRVVKNHVRN